MPQTRANGLAIAYESIGREEDPAVLMIKGLNTPLTGWHDSLCHGLAAQGFRVVRFDNRDVGQSTRLAELGAPDLRAMMAKAAKGEPIHSPYSLEDMAEDGVALLNALGIADAHIVGSSMGGMIAQLIALDHPERTRSLVSIMSSTGRPGLPQARPEAMQALMKPPKSERREDRLELAIAAAKVVGSPGFPASEEELIAFHGRNIDRSPSDPQAAMRQMAAVIAAPSRAERLKTLAIPTLVIHGADDPLVPPEHGRDTAQCIPDAELLIVPGMGHDFTEALVPVYLHAIGAFVRKVEERRKIQQAG